MEQAKIEQLAFLYLCSEHDKRLLLKKEKMPLADFDRLTYLIYHLGFKEYHINDKLPENLKHLETAMFFNGASFKGKSFKFVTKIGKHKFYK